MPRENNMCREGAYILNIKGIRDIPDIGRSIEFEAKIKGKDRTLVIGLEHLKTCIDSIGFASEKGDSD